MADDTLMDCFHWKRLAKFHHDEDEIDDFLDLVLSTGEIFIKDKLPYEEWEELFYEFS
jgi:hypothetical protein